MPTRQRIAMSSDEGILARLKHRKSLYDALGYPAEISRGMLSHQISELERKLRTSSKGLTSG